MNEELILKIKTIIKSLWIENSNNYSNIDIIRYGFGDGSYDEGVSILASDMKQLIDEVYLELNPIVIEETPIIEDIIPE